MKKTILLVSALASLTAFAQVGINTETPKATLDVVGKPSETSKVDGIIAPRIAGDQLKVKTGYGLPQEGTLIYVTSGVTGTPSGQTINVIDPGYYYFDGLVWQAVKGAAIGTGTNLEPWYNQSGNVPATSNTQNIYQLGKVGVNTNSTTHQLEVKGDFKAKFQSGSLYSGIDSNALSGTSGAPLYQLSYISNGADPLSSTDLNGHLMADGNNSLISQDASGSASGLSLFSDATGSQALLTSKDKTQTVLGGFYSYTDDLTNRVYVNHEKIGAEGSYFETEKSKGVTFRFRNTSNVAEGFYTFPRNNGTANQVLVSDGGPASTGAQLSWKNIADLGIGGGGTVTNVSGTAPINVATGTTTPVISLSRNDLNSTGTSSNTATAPLTITNGTNAVVNGANTSLVVNNTAPLWNANQLNGTGVATTTPTNGQVLTYNSTTSTWAPATVATPSVDWHVTGNTDTEISTATETLDAAVASTNYLGTQGADNLVIATEGKTHAVLDTKGTLIGGGNDASSISWGKNNTVDTDTNSVALGRSNTASGDFSVAIGRNNTASSLSAIAVGGQADALLSTTSVLSNSTSGQYSTAIGFGNTVTGSKNQTIGIRNTLSGTHTAIRFEGSTSVIGSDNNITAINSVVVGNTNKTDPANVGGTQPAVVILGNRNGTNSRLGGVIVGSVNNSTNGYIFGESNTNQDPVGSSSDLMTVGYGANTTGYAFGTTVYSNNIHYLTSKNNALDTTVVGININPKDLSATQKQSDLTVKNQITIKPQGPTTTCDSTTLGAIRFNSSTNKHQGCGYAGSATTPTWNNFY